MVGVGGAPSSDKVVGAGSVSVALRLFFSSVASRPFTESSTQPWWSWPVLSRTALLVAASRNTAKPSVSPAITPTSVSGGWSGSAAGGGGDATTTGVPATAGAGARREGRKIGRSRVAVSEESGTAQRGLPVGSAGRSARRGAVGVTSTGAGTTLLGGRSSAPGGLAPRTSRAVSSVVATLNASAARLIYHLPSAQRRRAAAACGRSR